MERVHRNLKEETRRCPETRVLRRPKARPCDDAYHTLIVGLPVAGLLFLILPWLLPLIHKVFQ